MYIAWLRHRPKRFSSCGRDLVIIRGAVILSKVPDMNFQGTQNGVFPNNYESILRLKGVGSYIASAIASFAYNLPYAVLDGNVFRVLSRVLDIEEPD